MIGAGIGVGAASWLLRDGHGLLIEKDEPGHGASFGNAGCFNARPSSRWRGLGRMECSGLSSIRSVRCARWSYLPAIAPWLLRFIRAGTPEKARAAARALRPLSGRPSSIDGAGSAAGAEDSFIASAISMSIARPKPGEGSVRLGPAARNGVEIDEFDADELRQLEPLCRATTARHAGPRERASSTRWRWSSVWPSTSSARAASWCGGGRTAFASKAAGSRDRDRHRRPRCRCRDRLRRGHSNPLAAALGDKVPLETERGYHPMIRDPEAMPRIPTADADGKFVATPLDTGLRFAGTVELAGLQAPPDWRRAQILPIRA